MQYIIPILEALAAIPKIGAMVEGWIQAIVAWQMSRITEQNGRAIQDALAFGLRNSGTREGRLETAKRWQEALRRPRPEPTSK